MKANETNSTLLQDEVAYVHVFSFVLILESVFETSVYCPSLYHPKNHWTSKQAEFPIVPDLFGRAPRLLG